MPQPLQQTAKSTSRSNAIQRQEATAETAFIAQPPTIRDFEHVTPDQVSYLQRTAGNRAVVKLLRNQSAGPVQPKLTVGPIGDQYEQEADRVAAQVVNAPTPVQRAGEEETAAAGQVQRSPLTTIQRNFPHGKTHTPMSVMGEEEQLQRKAESRADGSFEAGDDLASKLAANRGRGQPLSSSLRRSMEPKFGTDFAKVRVHTGGEAVQMNRDIQAKAFTHGSHIYFNQGRYNPGSKDGRHLLAHELTHVVQQTGAGVQRKREDEVQRHFSKERKAKRFNAW